MTAKFDIAVAGLWIGSAADSCLAALKRLNQLLSHIDSI